MVDRVAQFRRRWAAVPPRMQIILLWPAATLMTWSDGYFAGTLVWPPMSGKLAVGSAVAGGVAAWLWLRSGPPIKRLVLLVPVTILMIGGIGVVWRLRLRLLRSELRQAGVRTTVADFSRSVPTERDAAPALAAWMRRYAIRPGFEGALGRETSRALSAMDGDHDDAAWSERGFREIEETFRRHQEYFVALDREIPGLLEAKPDFYPVNFEMAAREPSGDALIAYRFAPLIGPVRCLRLLAERHAWSGRRQEAWRDVVGEIELAAHILRGPPHLLAEMVGIFALRSAARTAQSIMSNRAGWAMPARVADLFRSMLAECWTADAMAVESAHAQDLAQALGKQSGRWLQQPGEFVGRMAALNDAWAWYWYRGWLPPNWHQPTPGHPRYRQMLVRPADRSWPEGAGLSRSTQENFHWREESAKALIKLSLIQSALHGWRNQRGRLPTTLGQIPIETVPSSVRTDYFSGMAFIYKLYTDGSGFELKSLAKEGRYFSELDNRPIAVWEPRAARR